MAKYVLVVEVILKKALIIEAEDIDALDKFCAGGIRNYIDNHVSMFDGAPSLRVVGVTERLSIDVAADAAVDANGVLV